MEPEEKLDEVVQDKTIKVNMVGLKYMKSQHLWRLEMDIYEEENPKVKALMDLINKDFYLLLVPIDNK
jgi:hypothetical protein